MLIATPSLGQQDLIRNDPNQKKASDANNKDLADSMADTPPCQHESNKNDVFESMYPYLDINQVKIKDENGDGQNDQNIIIVTSKIKDMNTSAFDKFKEHSLLSESNSRYGFDQTQKVESKSFPSILSKKRNSCPEPATEMIP